MLKSLAYLNCQNKQTSLVYLNCQNKQTNKQTKTTTKKGENCQY